jgi:hypothetical protein
MRTNSRPSKYALALLLAALVGGVAACGYRYYAGPLRPASDARQVDGMRIDDDGSITFVLDRLEVGVRPQTDEELNRLYALFSQGGVDAINPFTYGDWQDPETHSTPQRFTVFRLKVKNYTYPKVIIDPTKVVLVSASGREYRALDPLEFAEYFRPYATAYAGNVYKAYEERKDMFTRVRYTGDPVFSGQENDGFLVFPVLHPEVQTIRFKIEDVAVRFDFRGEPTEILQLEYVFHREVGRIYPGGQEPVLESSEPASTADEPTPSKESLQL